MAIRGGTTSARTREFLAAGDLPGASRRSVLRDGLALLASVTVARPRPASAADTVPRIRFRGDWGATDPRVIEELCTVTAQVLVAPLSEAEAGGIPQRIDVRHNPRGPWMLFDDDEDSATIELSAYDNRWAQYLYQFSHEFGHVMCNYDWPDDTANRFQWLEEACCGGVALYCLERLGRIAEADPTTPLRDYGDELLAYVADARRSYGTIPSDVSLADWYQPRARRLAGLRSLTSDNMPLARWIEARFRERPSRIASLRYLYRWDIGESTDLDQHLALWQEACAPGRAGLVRQLQAGFAS